jgi:hypothetical protein
MTAQRRKERLVRRRVAIQAREHERAKRRLIRSYGHLLDELILPVVRRNDRAAAPLAGDATPAFPRPLTG